jgi:cytochrome c-type biogenesis protein CcmH
MAIWVVFALMTAAAVLAVLWPLSRTRADAVSVNEDAQFYRDQVAEIARDRERGLLSPREAEAAEAEAARRLLRATAAAAPTGLAVGEPALRRRRAVSAIALSTVPLLALVVYGATGSPHVPAQPLAARLQADPARMDVAQLVVRVEEQLARDPNDGRGWDAVAPVYLRSGRFNDAARAFENAVRLNGESAARLAGLGEALMAANSGIVSAEAREAFERALKHDPGLPRARFYLAVAAEQDGDATAARSRYADLLSASPADAPWVPVLRERLARLPGGGGAEAVATLPPSDRAAAIRGMVEGLAARLEADGGTPEEWSRLVRSYAVLGDRDKARTALARARAALASNGGTAGLEAVAHELELDTAGARR